jgi:hypothetical protein
VAPHSAQPGQDILKLRKLNLQATLASCRVHAKDVKDERRAVDDLDWFAYDLLEVGLLRWRELIIKDHYISIKVVHVGNKFLNFAFTNERARHRCVKVLRKRKDNVCAICIGKSPKLSHGFFKRPISIPTKIDANKDGPLSHGSR